MSRHAFLICALLFANGAHADANIPQAKTNAPIYIVPYAGIDKAPGASLAYGGAVFSLDGSKLTESGFVGRLFASYGEYENRNFVALTGRVQGHVTTRDALVGYQTYGEFWRAGGYVGVERQDLYVRLPDLGGVESRAAETGIKTLGEFETRNTAFYVNAMATYSDAFDTWWVRVRPGYQNGGFTVGPELTWQGNTADSNRRAGVFATMIYPLGNDNYFSASLNGGYAYIGDDSLNAVTGTRSGAYGGVIAILYF
ncbi:MAG: cellulose biosynthesis protein BcsS [Gallionellaceae bacterium]|jgi:hypothetical protein|nr:cellulose biosynthesis protein BcsS [Gallionellaceae bacterium]